jgi:hypothetical protein
MDPKLLAQLSAMTDAFNKIADGLQAVAVAIDRVDVPETDAKSVADAINDFGDKLIRAINERG